MVDGAQASGAFEIHPHRLGRSASRLCFFSRDCGMLLWLGLTAFALSSTANQDAQSYPSGLDRHIGRGQPGTLAPS